jgi:hypothetical protein
MVDQDSWRGGWSQWTLRATLLAVVAVGIAIALPSTRVADCPSVPRVPCAFTTNHHIGLRLLIACAGVLPALVVIARRAYRRQWFPWAVFALGTTCAVLVALRRGPVPRTDVVDCPPYRVCYAPDGRPDVFAAIVLFAYVSLVTLFIADAMKERRRQAQRGR